MIRIVAAQPDLHWCAGFHAEFGRREAEAFHGDVDDVRGLSTSGASGCTGRSSDNPGHREQQGAARECSYHQNHHPSPMLSEFGAMIVELRLLIQL
jgi:hypothetical protein